jgi:hypothetical protein
MRRYVPSSLLVAVRWIPVPAFRAVTVAPATTAPLGSTTVPDRSAALAWAWAEAFDTAAADSKMSTKIFPTIFKIRLETPFIKFSPYCDSVLIRQIEIEME